MSQVYLTRKLVAAVVASAGVLVAGAILVVAVLHSHTDAPAATQHGHAWLIVMENRDESAIVGSPSAPYLQSLIAHFGLAADYTSLAHSSQPNYLGLFSGGLQGVRGNAVTSIDATNIADQIEAVGETWRVYAQNAPTGCYVGKMAHNGPDGPGTYARKHEPAISFRDISSSPARCARITDFASFNPMAADFEMIVPNLQNDMHNGTTQQGDDFLRGFVPRILASPAWATGSPLFITWDEGAQGGNNKVATLVIAKNVQSGLRSMVPHNHYSLLRTIQELLGLPCLGQSCQANSLGEFFPGLGSGTPTQKAGASP
jgi:hypothetical protein